MAASVSPAHRVASGAPVATDVRTPTGPGLGLVRSFHSATPAGLSATAAGRAAQYPNPARHHFAGAPTVKHSFSSYQQSPWVNTVAPSRGPRPLSVPPVRFRESSADGEARDADSGAATFVGVKPQKSKPWTVRDILADTWHHSHTHGGDEVQSVGTQAEEKGEGQQKQQHKEGDAGGQQLKQQHHEHGDPEGRRRQQQQQQQQHGELPLTTLSGEDLINAAPATPIILAKTLEDKADEIIARYRLMEDRLVAVEHNLMDLARDLRTAPQPTAAAAASGGAAAATSSTEGAGEGSHPGAGGGGLSVPGGAGGGAAAAAGSAHTSAAEEILGGGGTASDGKKTLFEINRIQSAITEVANSGYLESVRSLRETLLVQEWGLTAKTWAQKRGVSAFEQWCAQHCAADVSFEQISQLYDDPSALHVLPSPRLRMMARAMIEQHTLMAYDEVYKRCTTTAEGLARVGLADLLPHTAGVGQVLRGLLPGGLPSVHGVLRGLRGVLSWPLRRVMEG